MISGILAIDKSLGWTSHDVVARVRRISGQRQVGHAGTLDPLATGLLLVVLGKATRLSSYLMSGTKEYCAQIVLGVSTNTDDAEGEIMEQTDPSAISQEQVEETVRGFVGTLQQHPPQFSALRQHGEKLYAMARRGKAVETQERTVTVQSIKVEKFNSPAVWLRVRCESGTYIRSLARDIGRELKVGGYLHALRRVESGSFTIDEAVTVDYMSNPDELRERLLPPDRALLQHPALVLDRDQVHAIEMGQSIPFAQRSDSETQPTRATRDDVRLYDLSGRLIALGRCSAGFIKPFRVFQEARDK